MLSNGYLQTLIDRDGLRGVTSNPAIFQKAIADTPDYDEAIAELVRQGQGRGQHLRATGDRGHSRGRRPVCARATTTARGRFGYVSLEVSPHLAYDAEGTVAEARHL